MISDEHSTFQLAEYFDFIYVDLEHGFRPINELLTTIRYYNSKQISYSVRVRNFDDPLIQTLLDVGVRNFVLPQLRTVNQLEIFKSKVSFPPSGVRGLHPKSSLKANQTSLQRISLTVIIETLESLEVIDQIASDPIVTDLYLGVFDLSMELEIKDGPYSPVFDEYFLKVKSTCDRFGKDFVAMLPPGSDSSFAELHSLDKVVVGIDSMLIHSFYEELTLRLRST